MKNKTFCICALTIIVVILLGVLQVCTSPCYAESPASLLKKADRCRRGLERAKEVKKKYRHNWFRCINSYESIYKKYPHSDQAAWALYHAGRLYMGLYKYSYLSKDLNNAVQAFEKLAEEYPEHRLADDGQYYLGEIAYKYKNDEYKAYLEFLKIKIRFPSGDMLPKAKKRLDELEGVIRGAGREDEKEKGPVEHGPVKVEEIRHYSSPSYTRVVVDLMRRVDYLHGEVKADPANKKPPRLYLDINNSFLPSKVEEAIKDGLVKRARAAQHRPDTVRVVLDLERFGEYKVFHLYDPFRIVVDIRRGDEEPGEERKGREAKKAEREPKGGRDRDTSLVGALGLDVNVVVIDPGHGGKDPGCVAANGVMEKDIVLDLAKRLARKIRGRIGCEVYLTREKDVFLPLDRRIAIANMKKADLFISLHVNAHRDRSVKGLETYFLNVTTDERAVMVAARENATSEKNISDLQSILNDLMLNTKIKESSRLAEKVQVGMLGKTRKYYNTVQDLGVKEAPFYVLIGAHMPAILVETGFLTNSTERKRLLSENYRERVAEGILEGVIEYIRSIDKAYQADGSGAYSQVG